VVAGVGRGPRRRRLAGPPPTGSRSMLLRAALRSRLDERCGHGCGFGGSQRADAVELPRVALEAAQADLLRRIRAGLSSRRRPSRARSLRARRRPTERRAAAPATAGRTISSMSEVSLLSRREYGAGCTPKVAPRGWPLRCPNEAIVARNSALLVGSPVGTAANQSQIGPNFWLERWCRRQDLNLRY
jgi:hypothetical protein